MSINLVKFKFEDLSFRSPIVRSPITRIRLRVKTTIHVLTPRRCHEVEELPVTPEDSLGQSRRRKNSRCWRSSAMHHASGHGEVWSSGKSFIGKEYTFGDSLENVLTTCKRHEVEELPVTLEGLPRITERTMLDQSHRRKNNPI